MHTWSSSHVTCTVHVHVWVKWCMHASAEQLRVHGGTFGAWHSARTSYIEERFSYRFIDVMVWGTINYAIPGFSLVHARPREKMASSALFFFVSECARASVEMYTVFPFIRWLAAETRSSTKKGVSLQEVHRKPREDDFGAEAEGERSFGRWAW